MYSSRINAIGNQYSATMSESGRSIFMPANLPVRRKEVVFPWRLKSGHPFPADLALVAGTGVASARLFARCCM
jgi:hypothetical protein